MSEQITGLIIAFLSCQFRNHGAVLSFSLLTLMFGFEGRTNGLGLIKSHLVSEDLAMSTLDSM